MGDAPRVEGGERPREASLLHALLEATDDGMLVVARGGRIALWNRRVSEVLGAPESLLDGLELGPLLDWLAPRVAEPPATWQRLREALEGRAEARALLHFASGRTVECLARPAWPQDSPYDRTLSFRDVTAPEREERSLREAERTFRVLYSKTPVMMHSIDQEGRLLHVSDAWLQRLGYLREEVIGRRSMEFLTDASRQYAQEVVLPAFFASGSCKDVPYQFLTKSGEVVDVLLSALCETDALGNYKRSLAVLEDVTERKRAEAERERVLAQERKGREVLEEAQRRTRILAEAGEVLSASLDYQTTLARLAELCVRELADWSLVDLVEEGQIRRKAYAHADPAMRAKLGELGERFPPRFGEPKPIGRVITGGQPLMLNVKSEAELARFFVDPEHRRRLLELGSASAMVVPLIARGQVLGAFTLVSRTLGHFGSADLPLATELARVAALAIDNARLYRDALGAVAIRDEFLTVASHELKTPLTALALRMGKLQRDALRAGDGRLPAKRVLAESEGAQRNVKRLSTILEQLLDISSIASGPLQLRRQDTELGALVRSSARELQGLLAQSGSSLGVDAPEEVRGNWDANRLGRVVFNLLYNAIKFGEGRPIEVRVSGDASRGRVSVRDHGMGLAASERERIFGKFERLVSAHHFGGLGVGLFIARHIVEAHGGTLSVEGAPGEGSTFTVELPR